MAGRLYRMAKVVSANPKSWGIVDANEISGFKRVSKLSDLYSIAECILSSSYGDGVTDGVDAVGQIWHVSETDSDYKLTNWASRKSAAGWTKLFYGGLDTTVYKVLGTNEALPTTGIKNCIYLKLIETGNSTGNNNKYAEYVYTGDIAGTYDATKWEKLGEVTANIDLSEYYKKTEVYNKNEVDTKIDENAYMNLPVEIIFIFSNGYNMQSKIKNCCIKDRIAPVLQKYSVEDKEINGFFIKEAEDYSIKISFDIKCPPISAYRYEIVMCEKANSANI